MLFKNYIYWVNVTSCKQIIDYRTGSICFFLRMASGLNHSPPSQRNSGSDQIWSQIQNTVFRSGAAWWWRRRICWTSWRMWTTQSASRPRTRSSPLNRKQIRYQYGTIHRRIGSRLVMVRYLVRLTTESETGMVRYDTSPNRKQIR
jgi:hypothetical protein